MYIAYCWNLKHLLNNSNLRWTLTSKADPQLIEDSPDMPLGAVILQVHQHQRAVVCVGVLHVWRRLHWQRWPQQCPIDLNI
jgi:hypothetical protein